ncbi:MAG: YheU family protein [Magnetococcales bacterium]|nr:YheU family protein [Magnetococcales bacterium]
MVIPSDRLSQEALREIIEEFVTRDMPEDCSTEVPLDVKVAEVMEHLRKGMIEIRYDADTESCWIFEK